MKVLHLSHGYFPECQGGVESYQRVLLHGQGSEGVDVSLLTGSFVPWEEAGIETVDVDGITVHRLHRDDLYFDLYSKFYHPEVERLIEEHLVRERPDLIHVHHWIRLTSNLVEIAARHSIPAVVTVHDLYVSCPRCFRVRPGDEACFRPLSVESCLSCVPRFGHESERELAFGIELYRDQLQSELAMASRVLVADAATSELICESTDTSRERFEVFPLPYQKRFSNPAAPALPSEGEPLRFGYWGNITYRKGAQVLARAFAELMRSNPPRPAELHLFGKVDSPELDKELRDATRGLPVFLHGRYSYGQLAEARLHMAVFPMLCFETYGFVLDECFELGLPCLVTEIGAMAQRAGKAALRVPPKDASAMAKGMRKVLEDPGLLDQLRAEIPPPSIPEQQHVRDLIRVYEEVIEGPRPVATPIPARRRLQLLQLQRESAQGRACPEGGPR